MVRQFLHSWDGTALGEIRRTRKLSHRARLGVNASLAFDIPMLSNVLAPDLVDAADAALSGNEAEDKYRIVSSWRTNPYTGELFQLHGGPVIFTQETASSDTAPSLAVTCAGPAWRLGFRIIDDDEGRGRTQAGLSFSNMDRAQLAAHLIRESNRIDGNTWIRALSEDQAETADITIQDWGGFLGLSGAIDFLSNSQSLNGFDWDMEYLGTNAGLSTDSEGLALAKFVSAPVLGEDKTDSVVFQFGLPGSRRNNCRSATRNTSLEAIGNRFSHLLADAESAADYAVTTQGNSSISNIGVFEQIVEGGELYDRQLREEYVSLCKAIRQRPRRLYEIKPHRADTPDAVGRVPQPYVDFGLGDRVRAVAYFDEGVGFDVAVRVYSIDISYDESGAEDVTLGLYLE